MSYTRIQEQFNTLYDKYNGEDASVTLEHLATTFNCTKRNARLVINKMSSLGWLSWHPEAGRGKLSRIVFLDDKDSIKYFEAINLINQGKLDQALELLHFDHEAFSSLISDLFGIQYKDEKRIYRYAFSRSLIPLIPTSILPASEQKLLRKVCSGLVKVDTKSNQIVGDLAYKWEMLSPMQWRFYIRPNIFLHNEERLNIEQLEIWLKKLTNISIFSHIGNIYCDKEQQHIDIWLNKADRQLVSSLCSYHALFFLLEDQKVISCGPYKINEFNSQQLKLSAFKYYHAEHALFDEEEVLSIPDNIKPNAPNHLSDSFDKKKELLAGCYYLILKNNAQGLKHYLFPIELLSLLAKNLSYQNTLVPAYGLLPEYQYVSTTNIYTTSAFVKPLKLTLGIIKDNPIHLLIAQAIQGLLAKKNIQISFIENSFDVHMAQHENNTDIDIWLMEMVLENKREEDLLFWLHETVQLKSTIDKSEWDELETEISEWRKGKTIFPSKNIMQTFIHSGCVIPLFHEWY